ncbi:MAG: serine/threonine-protein kinase [Deltaproteobacteria bacterium]|nr:serine/threonine-protein kinase [Deltaproteobacteria bacterium]
MKAQAQGSRYRVDVVESFADVLEDARPGHDDEHEVRAQVYAALGVTREPVHLGRYRVGEPLGQGGAGAVYKGVDEQLGRPVAIKLVRTRPVGHEDRDSAQRRLLREARAVARLQHANVVSMFDVGRYGPDEIGELEGTVASEGVYVVMELVDGPDLQGWLGQSPTPARILETLSAAGRGLAAAHAAGLVHRDFKPGNVLVGRDRVKVADFGLARTTRQPTPDSAEVETERRSSAVTKVGAIAGTFPYMAPEQYSDEHSPAADQYAFCVTLYEALAGRRPFPNEPRAALAAKHAGHVPLTDRVPAAIHEVLARGLSPRPEDRFPSMEALLTALRPRRQLRTLLVPTAVVAAGLVLAVGAARSLTPCPAGPNTAPADLERAAQAASEPAAVRLREEAAALQLAWTVACDAEVHAAAQTECLTARSEERSKLVELVDAGVLDTELVVDALSKLPAPRDCNSATATPSHAVSAPPPRDAATVRRLQARLRSAIVLSQVGKHREAAVEIEAVRTAAEVVDYPPLIVATQGAVGFVQLQSRQIEQALVTLERAYWSAHEIDYLPIMATTARELAFIHGRHKVDLATAHTWERHADAALERNGSPAWEVAGLRNIQAANRIAAGDLDMAVELFRAAIDHLEASSGERSDEIAVAYTNLGEALSKSGHQQQAEVALGRAATLRRQRHGEGHVSQTTNLVHLAKVRSRQDRPDEAIALLEQALALVERDEPGGHPWRPILLQNLGAILGEQERYAEAIGAFEAAVTQLERRGNSTREAAGMHKNIGLAYERLDQLDDAARHYDAALAGLASGHPLRVEALVQVGEFEFHRGNRSRAHALAQQAQAELDALSGPGARAAEDLAELRALLETPEPSPLVDVEAEATPDGVVPAATVDHP